MLKHEKNLDGILSFLRLEQKRYLINQVSDELQLNVNEADLQYYESKLINSDVVHVIKMSHQRKLLTINDKGIQFIEEGGFTKDKKWKAFKTVKEIIEVLKP